MKVIVVGAGAIGGVIGSALYEAGVDISLVDISKEHVEAIQKQGLTVVSQEGDHNKTIPAFTVQE